MPFAFKEDVPRRWGTRFDSLAPASSPPSEVSSASNHTQPSLSNRGSSVDSLHLNKDDDKISQDASIFVGSLPGDVDQFELIDALSVRMSQFAVIKNIKIVRDTRGGVCAFVQCEDAAAAENLVDDLRSTRDQPIFGRFPRYEKARSLRSLLLSYRAPTMLLPIVEKPTSDEASGPKGPVPGETIAIEPATAMRVFRSTGSRFHSLRYNKQVGMVDDLAGGLLLSPLRFDAESISKLVSFFGPIENIHNIESVTLHPPHDAPRGIGMDNAVWEVKFSQRSDALNALMTLRTVPHLSITWAHQNNDVEAQKRDRVQDSSFISTKSEGEGCAPISVPSSDQKSSLLLEVAPSTSPPLSIERAVIVPTPKWTSIMDDDFPPLMGKQGSWADEVATHDVSMLSCDTNVSSEYTDDVPLTPGFTTSPTTPKTSSGFPCTPRDTSFDLMSIGDREGSDLDRMSLFVGGFPAYWEEANIREIFQRFAGLMTVKVVRPTFKKGTAFAFVKFDNPDSARQAIEEEHDRVHDKRIIRVQLRDLNPPSRYGPKRRFHYQHSPPESQGDISVNGLSLNPMENIGSDHEPIEFVDPTPLRIRVPSPAPARVIALPATPVEMEYPTINASTPVSTSPVPSAPKTPAVTQQPPMVPYPGPYYAPAPWMTGYPPPYGYHIPYVPGYPPFAPGTQSYMPHTAPAPYPMSHDHTQQPPLLPTGFIQGEQGTLVPVYQAEALERYMSGTRQEATSVASPTDSSTPTPTTSAVQPPQYAQMPLQYAPPSHAASWGATAHQYPLAHGHYAHHSLNPGNNGGVSSTHRTPLFPAAPGFQQHNGKRHGNHRHQGNNNFNRSMPQRVQHNPGTQGQMQGFDGWYAHQMPVHAQQHVQDWTMWAGNR